ncbi:MAG: glycine/sarcosine/betaine reductase selenoprotein B family protein [Nitriliruptoraceae bacterium]
MSDGQDEHPGTDDQPRTLEWFRRSFYYGDHADMQWKFLANLADDAAAEAIAEILHTVGEVLDTGDLDRLREAAYTAQLAGYTPQTPPEPKVDAAPFTPLEGSVDQARLALITAGGVFVRGDDPMGPDGPTQAQSLGMITEFLRGSATLSTIPVDTPLDQLTARHPGYDATTAQRDPQTVFPLGHLRELADDGRVKLTDEHYAFTGATSQRRLEKETAPAWAEHMAAREVDVALLVAT